MSERKYRQRGYQDDPRARESRGPKQESPSQPKAPGAPRTVMNREPRAMNMPGFHDVLRCARCGNVVSPPIGLAARCGRCGADLHTCTNCVSFDTGSRFECSQPIPARITPKDAGNECTFFQPRTTVERETHSAAPTDARKAFDDLFK